MSSSGGGGGQQFRYTQTPSKVLHLRNLPWECAEEELVELCKPFGRIVNTKCGVGANRNQAFVEFTDINQAISMVSYFASSSEPVQIRGKTVYIQYSNRQEIINNRSPGETSGNVLLVTIEGVQASDVTIDVIHMVFSTFGFVHKIATFEKAAGFQALIQYTDVPTSSAAREALDGRSIPSYLLPEHVKYCCLRISFSAHKDLNIKFQSNRSRDYTNPCLPINHSALDGSTLQPAIGADGRKVEAEAAVAKEALEGHCIYDGGYCKLHLSYSHHTDLNVKAHSDKSRDYTIPAGVIQGVPQPPGVPATSSGWQGNPQAAGAFAPPGVVAQSHGTNGQVPNWSQGNSVHPPVPGAYPGQMFSSTVQYPASGGVPTPAAPQQMPPPHHGNQQLRPAGGAPGTGQPPPPPQYYR